MTTMRNIQDRTNQFPTFADCITKFTHKSTDDTKHRPLLHNYLGKTMTFTATYSYKSIDHEGEPVALVKNVRDIYNTIIADHLWLKIDKTWNSTLNIIPKESQIKITGKVCTYAQGTKTNIRIKQINLIHRDNLYRRVKF